MGKIFGYCRISRKEQSIDRQIRNIKAAYPDAVIIQEAYTGTRIEGRAKFERLLQIVKAGDVIVFDSVSRMSRDAAEGFKVYKDLFDQGVTLEFLKEPQINTETYKAAVGKQIDVVKTGDDAADELTGAIMAALNRYMMRLAERQIMLAFAQAEKEVKDLRQRTKEGIETARLNGEQIGQRRGAKLTVKKAAHAKDVILAMSRDFHGVLADGDVIKLTGISRNTFYKYKTELKEEAMAAAQ